MVKSKWLWLTSLLILFVVSYIREVSFLSINAIIAGETEFYAKTVELSFLSEYSENQLIKLKIALTIAFSILFGLITLSGLYLSFTNKLYFQIAMLIYSLFIAIAVVFIGFGFLFDNWKTFYPLLRKMIGMIHNPLIYIIVSSIKLIEKNLTPIKK